MARHRQPREVAELTGAVRNNPQRYRDKPPACEHELGNAPDHLPEDVQSAWFELATYAPANVLKGADRLLVEITSTLLAKFREAPYEFKVGEYSQLVSCLARLGMSPADRQKLGTEGKKEDNPFDDL